MEKNNINVGILISAFIALLLGVILVDVIAQQTEKVTSLTGATDTIDLANARLTIASSVNNETIVGGDFGNATSVSGMPSCKIASATVTNATSGTIISSGNYSLNSPSNCYINFTANSEYLKSKFNISYSYTYWKINETYWYHLTYGCPMSGTFRIDVGSECYVQGLAVKNSSDDEFTLDTDYSVNTSCTTSSGYTNGDIKFLNSSALYSQISNSTTVSYAYCVDNYLNSGWGRTITDLIAGFFVLGILGTAVWFAIWYIKEKDW